MADIRKWNNLTSDVLKEGQRLLVEAPKNLGIDKSTLLGSKNDKGVEELKSDSKESEGLKKTIETGIAELIEVPQLITVGPLLEHLKSNYSIFEYRPW